MVNSGALEVPRQGRKAAFEAGDQRIYHVACVSCGGLTPIEWANIEWEHDRPETAYFRCPLCDAKVEERFKSEMVEAGAWIPQQPEVKGHASFLWTSLISPLQNASWGALAKEFLTAKDDPARLQVFVNTILGQGWKSQGDEVDEDALAGRVEDFGLAKIPAEVLLLTAACDVQADRLEITYCGWTRTPGECFVLAHQVTFGPTSGEAVWRDLSDLLLQRFPHPHGGVLQIDAACVDAGDGGMFDTVMRFCAARASRRVFASKGVPGFARSAFKASATLKNRSEKLYLLGVDGLKSLIFERLKRGKSIRFSNTLDASYFEGIASERLVTKFSRGRPIKMFEVIPGRRNEALDCLAMNHGARQGLALNLDMREASLRLEPQSTPAPRVTRSRWMEQGSY
jgi:phage terminase large subunit GpA-like protein